MNSSRQKPASSLAIKSFPHFYTFSLNILIYMLKGLTFSFENLSLNMHFICDILIVIIILPSYNISRLPQ